MSLTEENNRILHGMRRTARLVGIGRLIYWIILIGVSIGAYYYIQPYLEQLFAAYSNLQHGANSIQNFVNPFAKP